MKKMKKSKVKSSLQDEKSVEAYKPLQSSKTGFVDSCAAASTKSCSPCPSAAEVSQMAKDEAQTCTKPTQAQREAVLQLVAALPPLPGVYRFFDTDHQVLYVGKARNLKNRVSSYFRQDHSGTRIGLMVARIAHLETTTVRTEAEALLLENNLIKTLNPRFNILFRDDKSYPYLRISYHKYPRMSYYRGAVNKAHQYYGPYPNAWAVRESIQLLQKLFKLRTCEDTVFAHRDRPCLLYQIKRCSGPCVKMISEQDYAVDVKSASEFLEGDAQAVMGQLQQRMASYSQALAFEQAALVRDQLAALAGVLQQQMVETNTQTQADKEVDVIAVKLKGGKACVNLAMVRGGRHLGDRAYFPTHVEEGAVLLQHSHSEQEMNVGAEILKRGSDEVIQNDLDVAAKGASVSDTGLTHEEKEAAVLEAFIAQHYIDLAIPSVLVLSHPIRDDLIEALQTQAGRRVHVVTHPREQRRVWLEMAQQGATLALERLLSQEGVQRERVLALAQALSLDEDHLDTLRIECFDISHTAGEATMASCVVFEGSRMQHSQYRRYNIKGITPGDDYAAMKQALLRRYSKLAQALRLVGPDDPQGLDSASNGLLDNGVNQAAQVASRPEVRMPDLVLIDGGKGQVSMAREVFEQLGLDLSAIVGVEKGEGRKVGLEELVFADGRAKTYLGSDSPALMLVAEIRDEAHRFAITGMRAQRAKARTGGSRLEDIAGVGPKRRARLLQRFGGVRGVAAASQDELQTVEGISKELAYEIYQALR